MRKITFILLLFAVLSAHAQSNKAAPPTAVTISYRIDYIRPDSFYIVEVRTTQAAPGIRGKSEEDAVLIKDTAQITAIMEFSSKNEAEALRKAAEYRAMNAAVTELYATLRKRIANNQ